MNYLKSWSAMRWVLIALVVCVGLAGMPKWQYIGDPVTIRAVTANWLNTGRWDVPKEVAQATGQQGQYYYQNPNTGLYYSKYGTLNILSYVPVLALERALTGTVPLYNMSSTRTLMLNIQNILLSIALALILLEISRLFTERAWVGLTWVLISLYASFGWNYLRAQTAELLQWLLASLFIWASLRCWRTRGTAKWLIIAQSALVLLVLAKGVYALWGALWLGLIIVMSRRSSSSVAEQPSAALEQSTEASEKSPAASTTSVASAVDSSIDAPWKARKWGAALIVVFLGALIVLAINQYKFGDPFASGYTQWERERHFFDGNIWEGLWGFLFSPAKSIFLYQPLLVLAIFCWPAFWKRWRVEAIFILAGFAVLWLFISCTINWGGHWSYGPRYLLVILTPLSLPSLLAFEYLLQMKKRSLAATLNCLLAAVLLFSTWMQFQVNSLEFFTYYQVEAALQACGAHKGTEILQRLPFGIVHYQLKQFAATDQMPAFLQVASQEMSPELASRLQGELLRQVKGNWFFVRY